MLETPQIESPCRLICQLDLGTGHCLGCGRSRAEIACWTRLSDAERRSVTEGLPARMKRMGFPDPEDSETSEA